MRARSRSRTSKRKRTESSSVAASERKRILQRNESEHRELPNQIARRSTVFSSIEVDKFCWLCHTETDDRICITCHRAYHDDCLKKNREKPASFSELGVCPECQKKSVDGTELKSNKFFNADKLKRMLDVLTLRSFDKKQDKNEIFKRWPEKDKDKLYKIMDCEILRDNINHAPGYENTAKFFGDVKYIYHNACIIYGADSDQAKAAKNLRGDFMKELLNLEACPECYYYEFSDESNSCDPFIRLCASPHDIVWAKMKGFSFWPAKCLKVVKDKNKKGRDVALVRFFGGKHELSCNISKWLFASERLPMNKELTVRNLENSAFPKITGFKSAVGELLKYVSLYEQKYGSFPFHPDPKPYEPQEKVLESSSEKSSCRNVAKVKLEEINMNEDSEANVIDATTVVESLEGSSTFPNSVTNDITSPNGGLKKKQSPVTFIDMQFSSVSSAESNPLECELHYLKNTKRTLNSEGSTGAQYTETVSKDSLLQPDSILTENQAELDNEVQCIEDERNMGGVLKKKQSPVTFIDMQFSSVSSAESNPLECELHYLKNTKRTLNSEGSTGVQYTETVLSDSLIQPDSILTENLAELDNEVQCIGEKRNMEAYESFNPDIVVPLLEECYPELKALLEKARHVTNGLVIELLANILKNSTSVRRISKINGDLKRCRSDLKKMEEENERIKKEEAEQRFQNQELQVENESLKQGKLSDEAKHKDLLQNSRLVIKELKSRIVRVKSEETLKTQSIIQEKEDKLNKLEEEKRGLEKELEKYRLALKSAERKMTQNNVVGRDDIRAYKTMHYCRVCEVPAAILCCLNTSYCSEKCQEEHAKEHEKHCKREKQIIVHQTVSQKETRLIGIMDHSNKT